MSQTRIGTYWHLGHTPIEPCAVVAPLHRLLGAAGAVVLGGEVARGVLRVVVVVEEVPAGDVVHVAVAVVVLAVGEARRLDQVLPGRRRLVHARVVLVVVHVEHAVAVQVVAAERRAVVGRLGLRQLVLRSAAPGSRSPSLSQLMPVSSIATETDGSPRLIFQAPAALKPEICALPSVRAGCPGRGSVALLRVRADAKPNRSKRSSKMFVEPPRLGVVGLRLVVVGIVGRVVALDVRPVGGRRGRSLELLARVVGRRVVEAHRQRRRGAARQRRRSDDRDQASSPSPHPPRIPQTRQVGGSRPSTSAAPSRAIRERGTTRLRPAASARLRVSWSTCE